MPNNYMTREGIPPQYGNVAPTAADIQAIAALLNSMQCVPPEVVAPIAVGLTRVINAYARQFVGVADAEG